LIPNGHNNILFGNLLRTDGFSLNFLFFTNDVKLVMDLLIKLENFTMFESDEMHTTISIDPERKSVFTAAIGSNPQIQRYTRYEYQQMTGATNFAVKLEKRKKESGIGSIESNLPTNKTSSITKSEECVKSILTHLDVLFRFYNQNTAKDRFNLYQGSQRIPEKLVNILTHGTAKFNRSRRDKKTRRQRRIMKKKKGSQQPLTKTSKQPVFFQ
ncbi:hypothetical protein CLU79DRAFT_711816, partial [Phycomyces nitens]